MAKRVGERIAALAVAAAGLLFALLFLRSLTVSAELSFTGAMSETVVFVRRAILPELLLTALAVAAIRLLAALLRRLARIHLTALLAALWLAGTLIFLWGAGTQQLYDFEYVLEAARLFARGNYKMLSQDYLNAYSYQLGFCLPMEALLRLFPRLDLNLFMQGVNAVCSVTAAGLLAALSRVLAGERAGFTACALYLTCLPAAFYCAFVYATLPMVCLCAGAFLCFALYLRRRDWRLAALCGLLAAVAAMLKPNAQLVLLALLLCALVDALCTRDTRLPLYMALAVALALLLSRLAVWQYELRAGVHLQEDITLIARFTMGLQRSGSQAGWYNRYAERFFPLDVTPEAERAAAMADLRARLSELAADPAMAAAFVRDKLLSQCLEPTYGTLWYGGICEQTGPLGAQAAALYAQGGAVREALARAMGVWQRALYALAALGAVSTLRRGARTQDMLLPVVILGGLCYHMLFEAKSQYMFVYTLYAIPLAAAAASGRRPVAASDCEAQDGVWGQCPQTGFGAVAPTYPNREAIANSSPVAKRSRAS